MYLCILPTRIIPVYRHWRKKYFSRLYNKYGAHMTKTIKLTIIFLKITNFQSHSWNMERSGGSPSDMMPTVKVMTMSSWCHLLRWPYLHLYYKPNLILNCLLWFSIYIIFSNWHVIFLTIGYFKLCKIIIR